MKPLFIRIFIFVAAACLIPVHAEEDAASEAARQENATGLLEEEVIAHDPVMIREDGVYYLFTTGPGVTVWSSPDMTHWSREAPVFPTAPDWAKKEVPGFNGHIWAPDISFHDGLYYLYYSISSFGKNESCIGVATAKTLDPDSPEFGWQDHGIVVQSLPGVHNWNAIDGNLIHDQDGKPYLSWGSFWSGLKLAPLAEDRTRLAVELDDAISIASRSSRWSEQLGDQEGHPIEAGRGAIEAPFIIRRGDHYYLFASTGYCCRGLDSTYRVVVGRSETIEGPYLDRNGLSMMNGGGTLVLESDEDWNGVGHNGVTRLDGVDYIVYHGYDASTESGLPKLRIDVLQWDQDGWPFVEAQ
ncbi:family 43 glycosylhydrolase [Pelagicoccus sp. SDUM812003]|uniref:family 43 glycosylhydrolase n=1 Tax=Pelagicoccus sp. SDUM812003 TaxID=3041267 RepID=UPI0028109852|nr:family 43 glycosylhydrolase [Pelagicoccus sp. SDUM812003]MDQ8205252.1 family 43 glycosylhydrolase [Pelagicoccus sp. SDUM812003]